MQNSVDKPEVSTLGLLSAKLGVLVLIGTKSACSLKNSMNTSVGVWGAEIAELTTTCLQASLYFRCTQNA